MTGDKNSLTFEEEYGISISEYDEENSGRDSLEDTFLREDELPEWMSLESCSLLRDLNKYK